jgi:hypothetical protein
MEVSTFVCSICGDPSRDICIYCTKDACPNHLCERCFRCSDCCTCDLHVPDHVAGQNGHAHGHFAPEPVPASENGDDAAPPEEPAS